MVRRLKLLKSDEKLIKASFGKRRQRVLKVNYGKRLNWQHG